MAELMKLIEINGAFKSDLMKNFLSSAQYQRDTSLIDGSLIVTSSPVQSSSFLHSDVNLNSPSLTPSALVGNSPISLSSTDFPNLTEPSHGANLNDKKPVTYQGENLNGNTVYMPNAPSVNANLSGPRIMPLDNMNTSTISNLNQLNKPNLTSPGSNTNDDDSDTTNGNVEAKSNMADDLNGNANTGSLRQVVEPTGARPSIPDPNANNTIDIGQILSEVHEKPSELRQSLIDQVTGAISDAHLNTTINTYANVAAANERIQREANELPDISSLSVNGSSLWQRFMGAMVPEITKVINFCTKLPGFSEVEQADKICLIKQGCFEVMVARFCMLVDHAKEEIIDPTLQTRATRCMVREMPMGPFLDQFFTVAADFNPLGLTDGQIGMFTAVLMICPEREGLKNRAAIKVLQQLFIQALHQLLKHSHNDADKTLTSLINMVPVFHKINEDHLRFLRMIKMKSPEEFEKKFPALHKELFDTC